MISALINTNMDTELVSTLYFSAIPEEVKDRVISLDNLTDVPAPDLSDDTKIPILMLDKNNKKLFYDYVDKPIDTTSQRITDLENQLLLSENQNVEGGIF